MLSGGAAADRKEVVAVRAPELDAGAWYRSRPLRLTELRGRVVLLDFFTFGCINCMRNLTVVRALHRHYGKALTVVGVHSAKFDRERAPEALQAALERLGIDYAVVDDGDRTLADAYAIKGWPTNVLIDARGYIAATMTGEGKMETFQKILTDMGVAPDREDESTPETAEEGLRFPEKVLATEAFLAVANSGAGEVWLCGYDKEVRKVFCGFERPVGMAWAAPLLYVADAAAGTVTVIDTESGARRIFLEGLRSPWDLQIAGDRLLVAEAGSHRIAAYDMETARETAVWGNRFEALRDGDYEAAQLAQPSGLTLLGEQLWFVDAESSSLRYIEAGRVRTVLGEGLFCYGDDEEGSAPLQHPQGVVAGQYGDGCGGGRIFVADTYNGKIKVFDPEAGTLMTLLDTLHEPGGIAKKGCTLYIADTHAHAVIAFDLPTMAQSLFL